MKRKLLLSFSAALLSTSLMAGGIMTNTNQSAAYARMLARNATISIDGVYYNPAGLTKLRNGFHLSLNNQSIFQVKDVNNDYPYLHGAPSAKFTGDVTAPFFPGIYAAYKVNKLAISFGFNPVGGGGGAQYDKGLPSFEMPISDLKPKLAPGFGVSDYQANINFEGTSIFFGYQLGVSYEINPAVSLFAGVRLVTAKNTYKGSITNIMINPNTTLQPTGIPGLASKVYTGAFMRADAFGTEASAYYTQAASYYTAVSQSYSTAAAGAANLTSNGLGALTYAQAEAGGYISAEQKTAFETALVKAGQPVTTPIAQSQAVYTSVSSQSAAGAAQLTGGATQMTGLAASTGDKEVDAVQKGTGFTPIIGGNFTIAEKLTLAVKYEFLTKIELTNETKIDETGSFPDGAKSRSDMPALLSIGASYPLTKKLSASLGFNYYFDKSADYGKKDTLGNYVSNESVIDKNYFELALGLEYNITDKLLVSAGYLRAQTGVTESYQNDLSYSLTSNTVGFGGQYKISPAVSLNLGSLFTFYLDDSKSFNHKLGNTYIPVNEKYSKSNWLLAIGLDVTIGK